MASIHGNTMAAAEELAQRLRDEGENHVEVLDLARTDVSYGVQKAFYYDRLVLAASTYDGGVFPCMEEFLLHLKAKNYQKRTVALMENGSWAPGAARVMQGILESMKQITRIEPIVTIRSALNHDSRQVMRELAQNLAQK